MTTAWQLANQDRKRVEQAVRERKAVSEDYQRIVKNGPAKAAQIYRTLAGKLKAIDNDHTMPDEGKAIERSKARDAALEELRTLAEKVEVAGLADKAQQIKRLKTARPKVDEATRARIEGYYTRLADSGVPLERLIELADGDATALRCLEDLAPVLAMSARPDDPNAGDGFVGLVQQHALDAYGEKYREAYGEIEKAERAAYMSNMSVNQAVEAVQGKDDTPAFVDTDGQVISAA